MTRYLSGLCVAGLGLCGGAWLVVAAVAFGGESAGLAVRVNLLTGVGLIAVCCLSLVCWSFAWRQRMRVDGVLADRFPSVSKHEARQSRLALGRGDRRAGKLAERSARDARRAARRSARAGGVGVLGAALSKGGVRSAGGGIGSASPAGEPSNVAGSYRTSANGGNGSSGKGIGANRSGGTGVNGDGANGSARTTANGSAGAGLNGSTGDAAELIGQLREMLVPLLGATGIQGEWGAGAPHAVGSQPTLGEQAGASGLSRRTPPAASGSQPTLGEQAGSAASALPRRTPSASAFRPRATIPMPRIESGPAPVRQAPVRQRTLPHMAAPAVNDDGLGGPVDSEEAWW
jgi:hypothetical protein